MACLGVHFALSDASESDVIAKQLPPDLHG